ncbi:MAG: tripartite tricarboxylate transporter substrate binding protein [Betaproteobacteria bacterium]|nr:tripartite tricarboxylate transporter substrate binding protein [Betaproteobacteria bacterium]
MKRIHFFCTLAIAFGTSSAFADAYPDKPIRFVVPSSAGGGSDVLARMFAQKMSEHWGQQVVIDNRSGAGGIIGSEITAKAAPDGYTILTVAPGYSYNSLLYKKLPYDTLKDFSRVTHLANAPTVLVVHSGVAAKNIPELIAMAKAKPGGLNCATSGIGTSGYLSVILFKRMAGIDLTLVPYKGAGDSTTAIVGGQVQMLFTAPGPAIPHIRSGRLRALGVTSTKRVTSLPDVPTIAETLPGYALEGAYGILAPPKTPRLIIDRLNAEFLRVLQLPDIRAKLVDLGFEPVGSTPEQYTKLVVEDMANWSKIFKEIGIQPE